MLTRGGWQTEVVAYADSDSCMISTSPNWRNSIPGGRLLAVGRAKIASPSR
jgi:hypothetical protein